MTHRLVCCVLLSLVACQLWADDFQEQKARNWHQWRGPEATGVAPHGNPPTEWSETKNIKWKVEIPGRGSASPIVWGDQIFVLTAIKTDRTTEDADDTALRFGHPEGGWATEGSRLRQGDSSLRYASLRMTGNNIVRYASAGEREPDRERREGGERRGRGGFGRGGRGFGGRGFGGEKPTNFHQFVVICIDRNSGKTIWERTVTEVIPHEGHHQTGSFASSSPITDGKNLYVSFGSRGIYCFDLDGNPKWEKDLGDMKIRFAFGEGSSPALFGDTLAINWDQEEDSFIVALDARNGDEKWRMQREEVSTWATPLIVETGGRTQVVTSGENRVRSYDLANGKLVWECGGLGSNPIACPLVYDGMAIAMSGHRDPAGIAVPLNSQGDVTDTDKVSWQIDEITPYVSSPLLYGDTIYFVKSRDAIVSSIAAKTGKPIIDRKRLPDMSSVYASPVGASGRVYFCSREGVTNVLKHGPEFEVLATNVLDETIDASPAIVGDEMILRGEKHLYCISE
jgi:outer membrane protein assembly factor BamB